MPELTKVGFISKAHGFQGELQCVLQMSNPQRALKHRFLFIHLEGLPVPFFIEEMEVNGDQMMVKLEDIDTQAAARKLTQKDIFLEKIAERKKKAPLTWTELKGYTLIDVNEGTIGLIEEVIEYPMQYIARIMKEEKEILIPLNEDLIEEFNTSSKTILIDLPEGLLDIYR